MAKTAHEPSLEELQLAAAASDAWAQYLLGERYRLGEGVPQDDEVAYRWFEAAAEQGEPNAQNNLGSMLRNGMGTAADSEKAVHWYGLAANGGNSDAMFNLGKSYLHGLGTPIDLPTALEWFSRAAEQGHIEAICELGTMYRFGHGTGKNIEAAASFHVISALEGDAVAIGNLADYREELEAIALGEAQSAALSLARMYERGLGVDKDQAKTLAWLTWAAEDCAPDESADYGREVAEMHEFFTAHLPSDVKKRSRAEYRALRERARRPARRGKSSK